MTTIELRGMSRAEKLKMMHVLWEDVARGEDAVGFPVRQGQAQREAGERVRSRVEQVRTREEAKAELRRRSG